MTDANSHFVLYGTYLLLLYKNYLHPKFSTPVQLFKETQDTYLSPLIRSCQFITLYPFVYWYFSGITKFVTRNPTISTVEDCMRIYKGAVWRLRMVRDCSFMAI